MPFADPNALSNPDRLKVLYESGLLDSESSAAFDRLTRLASRLLKTPISLVTLVDVNRQFFKSYVGVSEPWASMRGTPLTHSFCQHVVGTNEPLIVEDARKHPLLYDNLAIPDMNVISYLGFPLLTKEGAVLGTHCVVDTVPRHWTTEEIEIMRDLSESVISEITLHTELLYREKMEAERVAALVHEEQLKMLSNFLEDASHEFRTPLTIISSSAHLMSISDDVSARIRAREKIQAQIQNLTDLIDALETIVRLDSSGIDVVEPVQVHSLIKLASEHYTSARNVHQVAIDYQLTDANPRIETNTRDMMIAFDHLMDNAVHYADEGGTVTIETKIVNETVQIVICNTGQGIHPDDLPRVFERFYRSTQSRTGSGFGLGLPIVHKIVTRYGGHVEIDSVYGHNTTVTLTLPLFDN